MLLTTCPTCAAQFKVQPEHLNVRQGRVMCGRCRSVFNAFESLRRVEDPPLSGFAKSDEFYPDVSLPMSVMGELPPSPEPAPTPAPTPAAEPVSAPAVALAAAPSPASVQSSAIGATHNDLDADIDPDLARLLSEYDDKQHKQTTDLYRSQRLRAAIDELEAETRDMHIETVKLAAALQPQLPPASPPEPEPPEFINPEVAAPAFDMPAPLSAEADVEHAPAPNSTAAIHEIAMAESGTATPPTSAPAEHNLASPIVDDPRDPHVNLAALGLEPIGKHGDGERKEPLLSSPNSASPALATGTKSEFGDGFAGARTGMRKDTLHDYAGDPANGLLKGKFPARTAPMSRWWGAGVALLAMVLALQLIFVFRDSLATRYAQLRAPFTSMCERLGCKLAFSRDAGAIKIDNSDLTEIPGKPGRYLFVATLVNQSRTRQDLPHLEVRLTDSANQTVISRNFAPSEYLLRATTSDDGIAPIGDLAINLNLEVTGKSNASGYALRVFYP